MVVFAARLAPPWHCHGEDGGQLLQMHLQWITRGCVGEA